RRPSRSGAGGVSAITCTPAPTSSRIAPGMAGQETAGTTKSTSRDTSSMLWTVLTPQAAAIRSAEASFLAATAATCSRSGAACATRMRNSQRQPLPMMANRMGLDTVWAPSVTALLGTGAGWLGIGRIHPRLLDLAHPAVDDQLSAGDEARLVRGEEQDR